MSKQRVFTTGEAAKICMVSQQVIIREYDAGHLKGFRIPRHGKLDAPGHRRIFEDSLRKLMIAWGIPTDSLPVAENGEIPAVNGTE